MGELPLGEVEDQVHNSGMADNRISEGLKSEITWNQRTFWLVMVNTVDKNFYGWVARGEVEGQVHNSSGTDNWISDGGGLKSKITLSILLILIQSNNSLAD